MGEVVELADHRETPHQLIIGVCTTCCETEVYFIPEPESIWHVNCVHCGHPTVGPVEMDQDVFEEIMEDFLDGP